MLWKGKLCFKVLIEDAEFKLLPAEYKTTFLAFSPFKTSLFTVLLPGLTALETLLEM